MSNAYNSPYVNNFKYLDVRNNENIQNFINFKSNELSNFNESENESVVRRIQTRRFEFVFNEKTGVYEVDGRKPPIWIYWDKDRAPTFAVILTYSIQCVNSEFRVIWVHDSNIAEFWPDYPRQSFARLAPAHRADVLRVNLLRIFGGIFLDIDTFPLQSFYPYYQLLETYDLVGATWETLSPVAMGHVGPARAGHPFFKIWSLWQSESMNALMEGGRQKGDPFGWPELLAYIAIPLSRHLIRNKVLGYYAFHGQSTVGQLVERSLEGNMTSSLENVTPPLSQLKETPILYVHHSGQAARVDVLNSTQLLSDENLFAYFVKCALKQCSRLDFGHYDEYASLDLTYLHEMSERNSTYSCYDFKNRTLLAKVEIKA